MALWKRVPLVRNSWIKRGTKPMPKINKERTAKRQATYRKYLASAAWKEKRQAALRRAGYECERCGSAEGLQVHHTTYARFGGDELPEDLETLCITCHAKEEAKHPTRKKFWNTAAPEGARTITTPTED